jgi:hypothetical protein
VTGLAAKHRSITEHQLLGAFFLQALHWHFHRATLDRRAPLVCLQAAISLALRGKFLGAKSLAVHREATSTCVLHLLVEDVADT